MAKTLTPYRDVLADAIRTAYKADHDANYEHRSHLGMSVIGGECSRQIFYGYRWAAVPQFQTDTLWMFQDGHIGEEEAARRIRMIPGATLDTHDANGNQYRFSDYGGHFAGSLDGALDLGDGFSIWENKNSEKCTALRTAITQVGEDSALAKWSGKYYAQAICYMGYSGLPTHTLTAWTPGNRDVTVVRTKFDPVAFERFKKKALTIIQATEPPPRVALDPKEYPCSFCDHRSHCHGEIAPAANCRTCVHATPIIDDTSDGQWRCEKHDGFIDAESQAIGCDSHLFIPALLAFADPVDSGLDYVDYRMRYPTNDTAATFRNGANGYTSTELSNTPASLIGNPMAEELRRGGAVFIKAERIEA